MLMMKDGGALDYSSFVIAPNSGSPETEDFNLPEVRAGKEVKVHGK